LNTETYEEGSRRLNELLLRTSPAELPGFFARCGGELTTDPKPFAAYFRRKMEEKGLLRQNVFLAADISEGYGYKLISEEKRTRKRDTVLRLCFAARFRPEEAREALILYGMAPLHGRFPRDAVLLVALQAGLREIPEVNELLRSFGLAELR
jgi:hypothetical protein